MSGGGQSALMKCPTWKNSSGISKTSEIEIDFSEVHIVTWYWSALAAVKPVFVCRLYHERLSQVNSKLGEVEAGRAAEYLDPLAVLLENMQVRTKVAGKQGHADTLGTSRTLIRHSPRRSLCLSQVSTESCVWSQ